MRGHRARARVQAHLLPIAASPRPKARSPAPDVRTGRARSRRTRCGAALTRKSPGRRPGRSGRGPCCCDAVSSLGHAWGGGSREPGPRPAAAGVRRVSSAPGEGAHCVRGCVPGLAPPCRGRPAELRATLTTVICSRLAHLVPLPAEPRTCSLHVGSTYLAPGSGDTWRWPERREGSLTWRPRPPCSCSQSRVYQPPLPGLAVRVLPSWVTPSLVLWALLPQACATWPVQPVGLGFKCGGWAQSQSKYVEPSLSVLHSDDGVSWVSAGRQGQPATRRCRAGRGLSLPPLERHGTHGVDRARPGATSFL